MNFQSNKSQQINKHFTALITFFALLPLVYYIPEIVEVYIPDSKWLNVIIAVGIIVPIISYIVIPLASVVFFKLNGKIIEDDIL